MPYLTVEPEYLREIITGKIQFRKCPICFGTGVEWWEWDEAQENVKRNITEDEAAGMDSEQVGSEPCRDCEEIGFVEAFRE